MQIYYMENSMENSMENKLNKAKLEERRIDYEIDWEDNSGLIAFMEWEKRNEIRKKVHEDTKKVCDFSIDDWILLLIYSNNNSLRKTFLVNFLKVFSERTGIIIFNYNNFDNYKIENILKDLVYEDKLVLEIGKDDKEIIFKKYSVKDTLWIKKLYNLIPESIKTILSDLNEEFIDKSVIEIVNYVNCAYPEYNVGRFSW